MLYLIGTTIFTHYIGICLELQESRKKKRLQQEMADLTGQEEQNGFREDCSPPVPVELYQPRKKEMELSDAVDAETSEILLEQAAGHVSAEFIYLYPPGIPIIAPGRAADRAGDQPDTGLSETRPAGAGDAGSGGKNGTGGRRFACFTK